MPRRLPATTNNVSGLIRVLRASARRAYNLSRLVIIVWYSSVFGSRRAIRTMTTVMAASSSDVSFFPMFKDDFPFGDSYYSRCKYKNYLITRTNLERNIFFSAKIFNIIIQIKRIQFSAVILGNHVHLPIILNIRSVIIFGGYTKNDT